jgi:ferrochelatase
VRYAFRHSEPRAPAVLANLAAAGVKRIVAVPMYPQWSASTTGSAVRDAVSAGKTFGIPVEPVGSFPDNAGFIEALSEPLNAVFSPGDHVIFCAHGLPMKLIRRGDPYLGDVGRTVDALRSKLPPGAGFSTAFQSRVGRMEWTGPDVKDEVRRLAREGNRSIVVVPVSFACENLETLHELDVDLRAFAEGCGVERFMRVPAPGTHPAFIRGLAGLIEAARAGAGARGSDHGG